MKAEYRIHFLLCALVVSCGNAFAAEGVSSFRGPQGNGVFDSSLPADWGEAKNLAWSVEVPGGGWSSPVISGKQVFVTTAVAQDGSRPKGWGEGVRSMGLL